MKIFIMLFAVIALSFSTLLRAEGPSFSENQLRALQEAITEQNADQIKLKVLVRSHRNNFDTIILVSLPPKMNAWDGKRVGKIIETTMASQKAYAVLGESEVKTHFELIHSHSGEEHGKLKIEEIGFKNNYPLTNAHLNQVDRYLSYGMWGGMAVGITGSINALLQNYAVRTGLEDLQKAINHADLKICMNEHVGYCRSYVRDLQTKTQPLVSSASSSACSLRSQLLISTLGYGTTLACGAAKKILRLTCGNVMFHSEKQTADQIMEILVKNQLQQVISLVDSKNLEGLLRAFKGQNFSEYEWPPLTSSNK
jgi:hypothetical protein